MYELYSSLITKEGKRVAHLDGMEMKFTVLKNEDIKKYVPKSIASGLEDIQIEIEEGRKADGKKIDNTYLVINTDEPYADEVIDILKRHGHWG